VDERLPLATLVVNLTGSALLGAVVAADVGPAGGLLVGTGFCGTLTTYSSFSVETVALWERGERLRATGYALGTLLACLAAATLAGVLVAVL
jgi:CrcB protein